MSSLRWGLAICVLGYLISIVQMPIQKYLGAGFQSGIERMGALPTWYLAVAVLTAGIVEEALYRGYAFHRLAERFGNAYLAGAVVLTAFGAAHIPSWGFGASIGITIAGFIPMLVFIWRRDLYAFMIAHVLLDATGLILVPRVFGLKQ
ncbi:MAG TPA: CPBP family intramembrane glutamic endopeptidase [Bdellovibrionales bacterium]|nr:CPBP family intramembrane glutamic endopeptidase [Bdellovibrionales bacterium]